ncbi:MAG: cation:proton antiporter [SAR324 cluster bacterium]|nr:cation:proton antiporter [SAR324 cluster bacterium]
MKLNMRHGAFALILLVLGLPAFAGGGGGTSLIEPLGAMLLAAAVVAIILSYAKQASLFAFIIVGVLAGIVGVRTVINTNVMTAFVDIGITLLLFMAGMEVDIPGLIKRWKLLLINGFGQIIGLFIISLGLGALYVGIDATYMTDAGLSADNAMPALIYFALCLTLSSTILVIGTLKSTGQISEEHGQVALGLMVLQDIVAVVALAILATLKPPEPGIAPPNLGIEVAMIFGKMIALAIVLYFVTKYLLNPLFKFFAQSGELLFIGTLGYGMGVAALCEVIHFSSGIGAFFAGATLAALPYRHEIEDKVEPLKAFGVILFFMGLGFDISELTPDQMLGGLAEGLILAVLVVVLTIPLMLLLGYLSRLNSKPAFLMGAIINQSSEFSLMLAVLCLQYKIFDPHIFIVVTLVVLISFFLSSLGHQFLDPFYAVFSNFLSFMDGRTTTAEEEVSDDIKLDGHIVIMEYNDLAIEIADFYAQRGEQVLLLDLDPHIIEYFEKQHGHSNIHAHYSNMADPDVWENLAFNKAKVVISCIDGGQEAELAISRWLKKEAPEVPFLAATSSHEETLELYGAGARYVIQTEYLAAKAFRNIFETEETKPRTEAFREIGEHHFSETKKLQEGLG